MITARYTKEDQSEAAITIDGTEYSGCRPGHWQWIDMERAEVTPSKYVASPELEPAPKSDLEAKLNAVMRKLDVTVTEQEIEAEKSR